MATMNICLSHDAAFRWLVRNRNPRITGNRTTARVLPCTSPFVSESRTLRSLLGIDDGKLEVLVRTSAADVTVIACGPIIREARIQQDRS